MNKTLFIELTAVAVLVVSNAAAATSPVEEALYAKYSAAGAGPFEAAAGAARWVQEFQPEDGGPARACSTCHGTDLTRPGEHVRTGKPIEPLAVSANPERLQDIKHVEKWLLRNCRWTLGRECTAQEKGDFVRFIGSR